MLGALLIVLLFFGLIFFLMFSSEIKAIFYKINPGDTICYFRKNPFSNVEYAKVIDVKRGRKGEKWILYKKKNNYYTNSDRLSYMLELGWRKVK